MSRTSLVCFASLVVLGALGCGGSGGTTKTGGIGGGSAGGTTTPTGGTGGTAMAGAGGHAPGGAGGHATGDAGGSTLTGGAGGGIGGAGGGAGVPVALATGFVHGHAVAVDATNVYFIGDGWHEAGGINYEVRLMQVPKIGGTPVMRYASVQEGPAPGIALDAANVYFCGSNYHTMYVPIAGGDAVDLTPTLTDFGDGAGALCEGIDVDTDYVYSAGGNDPVIWRMPKTGGTPVEFAGNPTTPPSVTWVRHFRAVDGTSGYWLYEGSAFYAIERAPVAGGGPSPLASTDPAGGGALDMNVSFINENLVVWNGYLYWARGGDQTIWSLPVTGGTPKKLIAASGTIVQGQIATDGTSIYWNQQNSQSYSVQKMPIAGGSQTIVVQDPYASSGGYGVTIAVDGTSVYWLSISAALVTTLYKAPK